MPFCLSRSCAPCRSRDVAKAVCPRPAASTAVALPMPLEHPVMRTTCRGDTTRCYPCAERFMGYAEKNLAPGETILHRARYHWIFYRVPLLLLLLAVLLGIASFYATQKAPGEGVARPVGFLALGFAVV